ALASAARDESDPAIAFNGTEYLVAWQELRGSDTDIYAARLTPAGVSLDGAGFLVSGATGFQLEPGVAASGSGGDFFVLWQDYRGGQSYEPYGARVSNA